MSETLSRPAGLPDFAVVLPGRARRAIIGLGRMAIAILLCLTPVTAALVLGWLVRLMRRESAIALLRQTGGIKRREALRRMASQPGLAELVRAPGLVMASGIAGGIPKRWLGGLWLNTQEGAIALLASLALTLPFGLLWLGAWWGGWENSFNKGYEQAAVGQIVVLAGLLVALVVLRHLPMALAHQAATGRLSAVLEWRVIRKLTRAAGWRTTGVALLMALMSLMVFGLRVLPLGMEAIVPGLPDYDEAGIQRVAGQLAFASAVVALLAVIVVRMAAARLYGRAVYRLAALGEPGFDWARPVLAIGAADAPVAKLPSRVSLLVMSLIAYAFGFAVVASVFVAQFFNHSWVYWVTHPVSGLPWLP